MKFFQAKYKYIDVCRRVIKDLFIPQSEHKTVTVTLELAPEYLYAGENDCCYISLTMKNFKNNIYNLKIKRLRHF